MTERPYEAPDLSLFGRDHVRRYEETAGEVGYLWNGVPTLLLSTTGRRSGERRTTPLIFGRDGDSYLVVASVGGSPKHPAWYLNLLADPNVVIQVRGDRLDAVARPAEAEEKQRLWDVMQGLWANYDVYQSRTSRDIPVVIVQPKAGQ